MFQVTQVGSWPRSRALLKALREKQKNQISGKEFDTVADEAVRRCVQIQLDAGVDIVVDGEQRRDNFYSFLTDKAAGTRLSYARITAPFSGIITRRFLDPGALVATTNASLFTLMDLDKLKIIINVLEKDIPQVSQGKQATITVDAFPGKEFPGVVTRYSQAVDLSTRTMAVEIDIDNRDHSLKPGMFANVTLVVGQRKGALMVPTVALMKDDQGYYLFTAVKDTARRVRTPIGTEQNGRTEILSGLDAGKTIITTGQQFVKDNGFVTIQQ